MNFNLHFFKKNQIPYSWETIFIGRKLNLVKPETVEQLAMEYLEKHPDCSNPNIAELAFGAKDTEIDKILENVFKELAIAIPKQGVLTWNLEKRKWRYFLLDYFLSKYQDQPKNNNLMKSIVLLNMQTIWNLLPA